MRIFAVTAAIALVAFAAGCRQRPDPTRGGGQIVPGSDQEKLQGVWAIETIETGIPSKKGSPQPTPDTRGVRYQFRGDRLALFQNGRAQAVASFALDPTRDPRTMTVAELDADDRPVRVWVTANQGKTIQRHWLYKFDGDVLVIAETKGDEPPTEFKPRPWDPKQPNRAAITILRLKKTDESVADPVRRGQPTAPYRGATYPYRGTAPYGGTRR